MKKLNITFCSSPDFGGNAKALYEYMKDKYDFNMTWIVYKEENRKLLESKGIKAILIDTDEFKEYIPTTDIFFTTQGNLDGDKTDKSLYVELWHGIGPKPTGFLGEHPSQEDLRGYYHMKQIMDYVIVPNDFWKVIFSAKMNVPCSRIKSLGMPIFDYFKNSDGKANLSKSLNIDVTKYDKVIMFMPTFRKGFNHNDVENINCQNIFNFPEYDEKELDEYLKKNNYLLIVKRHPGEMSVFNSYESDNIKNMNEKMLIENDLSVNEIINGVDMLITDYSSIGTEFLYFNRPLLYAVGDESEYMKNRGIVFSNFDFWTIGPKVKNIEGLIEETDKLLKDNTYYKKEREDAYRLCIAGNYENNCENICNFLFDGNKISDKVEYYKDKEIILQNKLEDKEKQVQRLEDELKSLLCEINAVYNSKGWKFLEKVRKIGEPFRKK